MAKIMIVEDEALIADTIELMLELMEHEVIINVRDAKKALEALAINQPDLALLDITLKGDVSGIELASDIRRDYNFPFVFLTSHSDKATLSQAKKTFPYGYVVKPFTQQNLMATIEMALHKFESEQEDVFPAKESFSEQFNIQLSDREYELLESLTKGLSYKDIGATHFLSINTVKTHLKSIFLKLNVKSRHEAVSMVLKMK